MNISDGVEDRCTKGFVFGNSSFKVIKSSKMARKFLNGTVCYNVNGWRYKLEIWCEYQRWKVFFFFWKCVTCLRTVLNGT